MLHYNIAGVGDVQFITSGSTVQLCLHGVSSWQFGSDTGFEHNFRCDLPAPQICNSDAEVECQKGKFKCIFPPKPPAQACYVGSGVTPAQVASLNKLFSLQSRQGANVVAKRGDASVFHRFGPFTSSWSARTRAP
ncbi:uncharacterized protein PFL1_02191 [Pseudozyma flocculosa PF-1]|nr:uncharacterized protein PFL1_02191 [Pseudozyma flocculosa PF-1]EPQ30074.1 hypothetical protein PFL1_02191 [Pseudozyma flocculosa PF-1]